MDKAFPSTAQSSSGAPEADPRRAWRAESLVDWDGLAPAALLFAQSMVHFAPALFIAMLGILPGAALGLALLALGDWIPIPWLRMEPIPMAAAAALGGFAGAVAGTTLHGSAMMLAADCLARASLRLPTPPPTPQQQAFGTPGDAIEMVIEMEKARGGFSDHLISLEGLAAQAGRALDRSELAAALDFHEDPATPSARQAKKLRWMLAPSLACCRWAGLPGGVPISATPETAEAVLNVWSRFDGAGAAACEREALESLTTATNAPARRIRL